MHQLGKKSTQEAWWQIYVGKPVLEQKKFKIESHDSNGQRQKKGNMRGGTCSFVSLKTGGRDVLRYKVVLGQRLGPTVPRTHILPTTACSGQVAGRNHLAWELPEQPQINRTGKCETTANYKSKMKQCVK